MCLWLSSAPLFVSPASLLSLIYWFYFVYLTFIYLPSTLIQFSSQIYCALRFRIYAHSFGICNDGSKLQLWQQLINPFVLTSTPIESNLMWMESVGRFGFVNRITVGDEDSNAFGESTNTWLPCLLHSCIMNWVWASPQFGPTPPRTPPLIQPKTH